MEYIEGDISFRCKHDRLFSNFLQNWEDRYFTIKTFKIVNFAIAMLSFACHRHINKCKSWYLRSWKISSNEKDFWLNLVKIERAFYGQWTQKLQTFWQDHIFLVTFRNWYLIAKIYILNWYFSAIFICF